MKQALQILVFILVCSCVGEQKAVALEEGAWRAELQVSASEVLPFTFDVRKEEHSGYAFKVYNAEEVIDVDEIETKGDSIWIKMPVFEGYIAGRYSATEITGQFIKESLDRIVPFSAKVGATSRFLETQTAITDVSGIWETEFVDGDGPFVAKGIFRQEGNTVTGTFRTETGDYRYLEGVVDKDTLKLSAFDGGHAFLFTAKVTDSTLQGLFYSGNHYVAQFTSKRNEAYELRDANALTFLKEGYERFDFSFPDLDGKIVSLSDERFANKAVLVQIMGSWCPNCMDETRFYVDYLEHNPNPDLEVVALAFEYAKTPEKAITSIRRLKNRFKVDYPILLAQVGSSDKKEANEKLPMLNHVLSYPTSIFITKEGEVHKIHTGFNGPATGKKYDEFKLDFYKTIAELTQ